MRSTTSASFAASFSCSGVSLGLSSAAFPLPVSGGVEDDDEAVSVVSE